MNTRQYLVLSGLVCALQTCINATQSGDENAPVAIPGIATSSRNREESELGDSSEPATSEPAALLGGPITCTNKNVNLLSVGEDLNGIFEGIENPLNGRQLTSKSYIPLVFDRLVNASQVATATRIAGIRCSRGGELAPTNEEIHDTRISEHHVKPEALDPFSCWVKSTTSSGAELWYPHGINVFSLGSIKGAFYTEGTIVATEDIQLTDFGVNLAAKNRIGLVAGERTLLTRGVVSGDIHPGKYSNIEFSFNTPWRTTSNVSVPVGDANDAFRKISDVLSKTEPTGSTTVLPCGLVLLKGEASGLNVFRVDSNALTRRYPLIVKVPEGSTVLVNISGTARLSLHEASFDVYGLLPNQLLWNAPDVRLLRLYDGKFIGSVLAPYAKFDARNAKFTGTLVVREVVGNGTFHAASFDARTPEDRVSSVILKLPSKLGTDCSYTLTINGIKPLNKNGECLMRDVRIPFFISSDQRAPYWRETEHSAFRLYSGIKLLPAEAFRRYAESIGLPYEDSLEPTGAGLARGAVPGTSTREWAQYHEGIFVNGGGYAIDIETIGGYLKSAIGGLSRSITDTPVPTVTADTAIDKLVSSYANRPYPWVRTPNKHSPPTALLEWFLYDNGRASLAWEIDLNNRGIDGVLGGVIDATTGERIAIATPLRGM